MKKHASLSLSVLAIIISVITLLISKPSTTELGIDYLGIIVGILALLVTVLIGWQIFQIINLTEFKKKISIETKSFIENELENKSTEHLSILANSIESLLVLEDSQVLFLLTDEIVSVMKFSLLAELYANCNDLIKAEFFVKKAYYRFRDAIENDILIIDDSYIVQLHCIIKKLVPLLNSNETIVKFDTALEIYLKEKNSSSQ